jgi:hypothetical protein
MALLRGWAVFSLVVLVGCGSSACSGGSVSLETDPVPVGANEVIGCLLNWEVGDLVVDRMHGTAFRDESGDVHPLTWPAGYTGRSVEGEVAVLDPAGQVVATTGGTYQMWWADGRPGYVVCDVVPE